MGRDEDGDEAVGSAVGGEVGGVRCFGEGGEEQGAVEKVVKNTEDAFKKVCEKGGTYP